MNIIVAIDSFKGTLTSSDLSKLVHNQFIKRNHHVTMIPISDGGEGFLESISTYYGEKTDSLDSFGPLMDHLRVEYFMHQNVAFLELNSTSGINKIEKHRLNPMKTSTYGLGILIKHVINQGAKKVVIGLGGSATSDGGSGMLQALGVKFYHQNEEILDPMNGELIGLVDQIDTTLFKQTIKDIEFEIASDVKNPLLGELGSVSVYSSQKGASPEQKITLEKHMISYAQVIETHLLKQFKQLPGSGAAGGVGFACLSLLSAKLHSGIDFIMDLIQLEKLIEQSDVVIVGEGRLDKQTLYGKAPFGIARLAKRHNKKVIGLFGSSDDVDASNFIDQVYRVVPEYATQEESIANPKHYFEKLLNDIVI